MRIYSVGNAARVGRYVAAPDPDSAMTVALIIGHGRTRKNLRATDVTDSIISSARTNGATGIDVILNGTITGVVSAMMQSYSLHEVLQGVKKTPPHWSVKEVTL